MSLENLLRGMVVKGALNHVRLSVAPAGRLGSALVWRCDYRDAQGNANTATADDPVAAIKAALTAKKSRREKRHDDYDFG